MALTVFKQSLYLMGKRVSNKGFLLHFLYCHLKEPLTCPPLLLFISDICVYYCVFLLPSVFLIYFMSYLFIEGVTEILENSLFYLTCWFMYLPQLWTLFHNIYKISYTKVHSTHGWRHTGMCVLFLCGVTDTKALARSSNLQSSLPSEGDCSGCWLSPFYLPSFFRS